MGRVCADRTPEKATQEDFGAPAPRKRDRECSYVKTVPPLEGPSRVGTFKALCLVFSKFRKKKILETVELILIITEKMNQEAIRKPKVFLGQSSASLSKTPLT